jgi:phosphoglycolate phosphatase-like HAD superfamily hydrolase
MGSAPVYTRNDLLGLTPQHDAFVGIDSDGCVFPTMEIKQKRCFHGLIVSVWHLEPIEQAVRAAAEFVNLYSQHRGQNRFTCLLMTFDLLRNHPEALAARITLPPTAALRKYCESGRPLSNPSLEQYVMETRDPEMERVLKWSQAVNTLVAATVKNIPPFRWVLESLEAIRQHADAICVSQTPTEALVREWQENDLMGYVKLIAGQELGTKAEHLTLATQGRYAAHRVLMIGDAPGDLKAARQVGAHFFPINPGHEEASWERFHREAFHRFLNGTFDRDFEDTLVRQFNALLPDTPPWIRGSH